MKVLRAVIVCAAAVLLTACASVGGTGRVAIETPPNVPAHVAAVVQCVGRPPLVSPDSLRWLITDADYLTVPWEPGGTFAGYSDFVTHTIELVRKYESNPVLIEHELAHSLYYITGHPADPFERCGWMAPIVADTTKK